MSIGPKANRLNLDASLADTLDAEWREIAQVVFEAADVLFMLVLPDADKAAMEWGGLPSGERRRRAAVLCGLGARYERLPWSSSSDGWSYYLGPFGELPEDELRSLALPVALTWFAMRLRRLLRSHSSGEQSDKDSGSGE